MSGKPLTIYRCLRLGRQVADGEVHDECADIIARNPEVDFRPGLSGVEVFHQVHQGTNWDASIDNYPSRYLNSYQGRLGYIIVSIRMDLLEAANLSWDENPCFYKPDFYDNEKNRDWYIAGRTALVRVRVEQVIEVVPLES